MFGTEGFKNYGVLNSVELAPGAYEQTFARVVNQFGFDATVAAWGKAYVQGNAGVIFSHYEAISPGSASSWFSPSSSIWRSRAVPVLSELALSALQELLSQIPISSEVSEEITIIATPFCENFIDKIINLDLGTHINAAGRLINN